MYVYIHTYIDTQLIELAVSMLLCIPGSGNASIGSGLEFYDAITQMGLEF